jgi:hypothetical protein
MRRFTSFFLRIRRDFFYRNKRIDEMEKLFLQNKKMLSAGKYYHLLSDESFVLLVNKRQLKLPVTLEQTLESYWTKYPDSSVELKIYIILRDKIWKLIHLIRLKLFKINGGLEIIQGNEDQNISAEIAMIRANGKVILFESIKNLIYTSYVKPSINKKISKYNIREQEDFLNKRAYLSSSFNIPKSYGFLEGFHCEELLHGKNISFLPVEERSLIIKDLCSSCIKAKKIETTFLRTTEILERGFSLLEKSLEDRALIKFIRSRKKNIIANSKKWKYIYSHNDLTAHNLIIYNNLLYLLDLAPHKILTLPSFVMPSTLMHSEKFEYNRTDLFEAFFEGNFDDEFSHLLSMDIDNQEKREDILLSESLILLSIGSKLNKNSLKYWIESIFSK